MADNIELDSGTGGATIKTDDDGTAHWQYVKMSFGADNTQTRVTSSVGLPVDLLAGTAEIGNVKNSGTFAVQSTLQAGTAEFGKLAAGVAEIGNVKNSGTFVTQIDGAALTALQLIDNTVYVDDADWTATTSSHNLIGGVYQSTPGTITDGDTGPIRLDTNGAIHINDGGNSITVDGTVTANPASGTIDTVTTVTAVTDITNTIDSTISGDALTALQKIDDIVHVDDAAYTLGTDSGVMMMGFAGTQSVNANDAGAISMETDGSIHIHDGGNSITIDGTVTANLSATDNAVLDQIEVNTSYGDNTGAGTEASSLRVTIANDSTGLLSVDDNGGSLTVDNGGTFATQATLQTGANTVGEVTIGAATGATGDLAKTQDVAMGANDVGIAILAVRDDEQAAMTPADGDYSTLRTDKFGNLKVTNLPDATSAVQYGVIDAASSGDNTLQAAAGAGIKIRVLSVMMVSAGTVTARFESGASGTALTGQMNLVANSGFTLPYNPAGWFETADNALLNLELSGAISVDGCFSYVEV